MIVTLQADTQTVAVGLPPAMFTNHNTHDRCQRRAEHEQHEAEQLACHDRCCDSWMTQSMLPHHHTQDHWCEATTSFYHREMEENAEESPIDFEHAHAHSVLTHDRMHGHKHL